MGLGRNAVASLRGAFFGMGLDPTRTKHGTVFIDDAEGELCTTQIKS